MVALLLGQPTVAREDDFFMVGGHSMLGAQLVARIRDAFGVKLTLRQLFSAPTVASLSAEVARLAEAASGERQRIIVGSPLASPVHSPGIPGEVE